MTAPNELAHFEGRCDDCDAPVGVVDLGDINGVAAMGWTDYAVIARYSISGGHIVVVCDGCGP